MKKFLVYFFFLLSNINTYGQIGSLDLTFDPGTGFNDWVGETVLQPDGKVIAVGNFTSFNGVACQSIARLNSNGSLDNSFSQTGTGFNFFIHAVAVQQDGKIVVGGLFTQYNGISRNHIARLNSDGTLDATFDPGTGFTGGSGGYVEAIAIQPDGKILVGGDFGDFNGVWRTSIARLNSDGSLDTGFDPGAGFYGGANGARDIILQGDGKILVGGYFSLFNGTQCGNLARLQSDGSLDATFITGTGFSGGVWKLALEGSKIIAGGNFTSFNGVTKNRILRLNSDGSEDGTFNAGTGFDFWVNSLAQLASGKILVGGAFLNFNGSSHLKLVMLNNDGSLDATFNSSGNFDYITQVSTIVVQSDGNAIIGGNFTKYNGVDRNNIARIADVGTTGINNGISTPSFTVYPNPCKEILTINTSEKIDLIELKNLAGETVDLNNKNLSKNSIHVEGIPSSIYILKIVSGEKINLYQIIKE